VPAILDQIIPQPAYQLVAHDDYVAEIQTILQSSNPYDSGYFFPPGKKIHRWQLQSGISRDFSTYFNELKGSYIEHLTIKDPYCGAGDRQINSLQRFVRFLFQQAGSINEVSVQCKEQNNNDINYKTPDKVRTYIKNALDEHGEMKLDVKVVRFSYGRNFHDRSVIASTVTDEGETIKHIYDLTGGIDFMMDESRNSLIFYSQERD